MAAMRAAIGIAEASEQIVEFADYLAVDERGDIDAHLLEMGAMNVEGRLIRVLLVGHEHTRIVLRAVQNVRVITRFGADLRHRVADDAREFVLTASLDGYLGKKGKHRDLHISDLVSARLSGTPGDSELPSYNRSMVILNATAVTQP